MVEVGFDDDNDDALLETFDAAPPATVPGFPVAVVVVPLLDAVTAVTWVLTAVVAAFPSPFLEEVGFDDDDALVETFDAAPAAAAVALAAVGVVVLILGTAVVDPGNSKMCGFLETVADGVVVFPVGMGVTAVA